jgi:hypothetical protein
LKRLIILGLVVALVAVMSAPAALFAMGGGNGDNGDNGGNGGCDKHKSSSKCEYPKVKICHKPPGNPDNAHTIVVGSQSAVNAHLAHGDSLGPCKDNGNNHKKDDNGKKHKGDDRNGKKHKGDDRNGKKHRGDDRR